LPALGFLWNFPFSILIQRGQDRDADNNQKREEKKLAQAEVARRFVSVGQEQIFAQDFEGQKRNYVQALKIACATETAEKTNAE
jgi:hypothetical protein